MGSPTLPRLTDWPLRLFCCAVLFIGFGWSFGLWSGLAGLISDGRSRPTDYEIAMSALAAAGLASLIEATFETGLVALGLRLTRPSDQAVDYDDQPPPTD